jgi:hypothetical protein
MSIAVLNQVYDEARRLAVAGSVVARGDFRLKKLVGPLEAAGARAPVFAKVAEAATKVIDGPEDTSAESLLELTSLVTAVLYTQGETGVAGELRPIESVNLGGETAQTSARLLKPLLEALSSTGSGRLELVKEAHERGAFRDLRLVKPALEGLDDPYPDVADFLAEKVLPVYGKAILPELRRAYDPKGTRGHPRRLKLMHALDPACTRDLVKQALEGGSKDVKVAAISCLGAEPEDLQFLTEQSSAKAQEVRAAAYEALSNINDPAAVTVLEKAITGKDLNLALAAMTLRDGDDERKQPGRLTALLVAEIQKGVAELPKLKDKKKASELADRLTDLIGALPATEHPDADRLTLDLFARRTELAKVKGTTYSGSDVVESVISRMEDGPKSLQAALARAHAELDPETLGSAVRAGREALPPAGFYDLFSPYLTARVDEKKKGKDPAWARREAVIEGLDGDVVHDAYDPDDGPPLDPRWLDLAVRLKHLGLVSAVARPGHTAAEALLQAEFDEQVKKTKKPHELGDLVSLMVHLRHPRTTDNLLAAYEKTIGKPHSYTYWYYLLIPRLPKAALPRLEALLPRLKSPELDRMVEAIEELRTKKD